MNTLLDSICKAGLNRARIHDALANIEEYDGVTGHMVFDPNQKNVAPMYLGTVHNGAITYRVARMTKEVPAMVQAPAGPAASAAPPVAPYARVGEDGVSFAGPAPKDVPAGPISVVVFGNHAIEVAQSAEMQAALAPGGRAWKLIPVASDQNWGAASTQLVHALMDDHALAVVALDRAASHLAMQLALKTFVPVVALSEDKSLTETNVPWIFRLPANRTPAEALALVQAAEAQSGPNSGRLRDVLASGDRVSGFAFLDTGEPLAR